MTWMLTGGAGYIGAHIVRAFDAAGLPVVVLDDLSTGIRGERAAGRAVRAGLGERRRRPSGPRCASTA